MFLVGRCKPGYILDALRQIPGFSNVASVAELCLEWRGSRPAELGTAAATSPSCHGYISLQERTVRSVHGHVLLRLRASCFPAERPDVMAIEAFCGSSHQFRKVGRES